MVISAEACSEIVRVFDSQGWHRTATEVDHQSGQWLIATLTHIIGRHPMDLIEPLRTRILHDPFADRTRYSAFSGIEHALWDLAGKAVGQPVHRLLGGAHVDRVRLYANINSAKRGDSPADLARVAKRPVGEGFTAIKMYPFVPRPGAIAGAPLLTSSGRLMTVILPGSAANALAYAGPGHRAERRRTS